VTGLKGNDEPFDTNEAGCEHREEADVRPNVVEHVA
jgi:hypothetical protein